MVIVELERLSPFVLWWVLSTVITQPELKIGFAAELCRKFLEYEIVINTVIGDVIDQRALFAKTQNR